MRQFRRAALACFAVLTLLVGPPSSAGEPAAIEILVLKEHGVGSPTLAQPYLDRFVGWPRSRTAGAPPRAST